MPRFTGECRSRSPRHLKTKWRKPFADCIRPPKQKERLTSEEIVRLQDLLSQPYEEDDELIAKLERMQEDLDESDNQWN